MQMIIIRIKNLFHSLTNSDASKLMYIGKPKLSLGLGIRILFRVLLISGFIALYFYSWILIY